MSAVGTTGPDVSTADGEVARPAYLGKDELDRIFSVEEFDALAEERMHPSTYAYVRGWAGTGWTVENNIRAFRRWVFRPRVLVDVSHVDTSTTVLGIPVAVPVLFAPTSIHKLSHPEGEVATARAACALQTLQVLSTGSSATIEEIAEIGPQRWFQLYWYNDRGVTRELVQRAHAAGYTAIVLTVDAAIFGWREGEKRVTLVKPDDAWAVNLPKDISGLANDQTLTWRSLEWLREMSPLPIVLKGIVRADDTRLAAEHGVDAVIVSNHGGRQADGAIATLDALPRVAEAAADGAHGPAGRSVECRRAASDGGLRRRRRAPRHGRAQSPGAGRASGDDRASGAVGPRGRRRGRRRPDDGVDLGRVPIGDGHGRLPIGGRGHARGRRTEPGPAAPVRLAVVTPGWPRQISLPTLVSASMGRIGTTQHWTRCKAGTRPSDTLRTSPPTHESGRRRRSEAPDCCLPSRTVMSDRNCPT